MLVEMMERVSVLEAKEAERQCRDDEYAAGAERRKQLMAEISTVLAACSRPLKSRARADLSAPPEDPQT